MKCNNISFIYGRGRRFLLSFLLIFSMIFVLVGCNSTGDNTGDNVGDIGDNAGTDQTENDKDATDGTATDGTSTDGTSTASIVDTETAFIKSVAADGNWITAITKDLTITEAVVVEGEFVNGKKDESGKDIIQRKIALYAQDADRNITSRFTLKIPTLTIKSPNASLQQGYFIGDIMVEAEGFQLVGNGVEGNIYFSSEEVKNTFTMDAGSTVTGVQEVKK